MRIWLPGELKEHKPFVVAKIWGWDPCWTVVWYEDGRYRGAMERLTMTDPDYMAFVDTVRVEPRIRRNLLKSIRNAEFYFRAPALGRCARSEDRGHRPRRSPMVADRNGQIDSITE